MIARLWRFVVVWSCCSLGVVLPSRAQDAAPQQRGLQAQAERLNEQIARYAVPSPRPFEEAISWLREAHVRAGTATGALRAWESNNNMQDGFVRASAVRNFLGHLTTVISTANGRCQAAIAEDGLGPVPAAIARDIQARLDKLAEWVRGQGTRQVGGNDWFRTHNAVDALAMVRDETGELGKLLSTLTQINFAGATGSGEIEGIKRAMDEVGQNVQGGPFAGGGELTLARGLGVQQLEQFIERQKAELEIRDQQIFHLRRLVAEYETAIVNLKGELQNVRQELTSIQTDKEELKRQIGERDRRIRELEEQLAQANRQLQQRSGSAPGPSVTISKAGGDQIQVVNTSDVRVDVTYAYRIEVSADWTSGTCTVAARADLTVTIDVEFAEVRLEAFHPSP